MEDKWKITDVRSRLKGTKIFIDKDCPPKIRQKRVGLFKKARKLRGTKGEDRIFVT